LGLFVHKITLSALLSSIYFPFFAPFLQNEPNSLFFLTYSFHNTSTFFGWVRLVKTPFFGKSHANQGRFPLWSAVTCHRFAVGSGGRHRPTVT
jgi:hypothetical protein